MSESEIAVFTGQELQKDQDTMEAKILTPPTGIEQSRAVAEAVASIQVAKQFPRSVAVSHANIMRECKRQSLAEKAEYIYPRGKKTVRGATIRLMEVIARNWGNIESGFDEIKKSDGASEIRAFCWDVETNTKAVKKFNVKHWRDTKGGGYAVEGERDKYELVANMAMRRVRACIENIIPGDIVEDALNQCRKTLGAADHGESHEDRIRKMVLFFKEKGVNAEMLGTYLEHKIDDTTPEELIDLHAIANAIGGNPALKDSFFKEGFKNIAKTNTGKTTTTKKKKPAKKPEPKQKTIKPQKEAATPEATDHKASELVQLINEVIKTNGDKGEKKVADVFAEFDMLFYDYTDEDLQKTDLKDAKLIINKLKAIIQVGI